MRSEEASAVLDAIGEDSAFAASSTFDIAQNRDCTPGRMARLKGSYSGSGAHSASAAATASGVAGTGASREGNFKTVDVMTGGVAIVDLSALNGEVIGDVTAQFSAGVSSAAGAHNMRDYLGFYRIADRDGGVDTDGDGAADVYPADTDYARQVQMHAEPARLYLSERPTGEQYLGEIRLEGGALYAPYLRFKGTGAPAGMPPGLPLGAQDRKKLEEVLRRGMQTPSHLYFVFAAANADSAKHVVHLKNNQLGFAEKSGAGAFDDIVFQFRFGL
ncbi:MAG: hypothetical protein KDI01_08020 [Halioglobus sp.]|nr:hypothetical protein [Halioglobus sp.]